MATTAPQFMHEPPIVLNMGDSLSALLGPNLGRSGSRVRLKQWLQKHSDD